MAFSFTPEADRADHAGPAEFFQRLVATIRQLREVLPVQLLAMLVDADIVDIQDIDARPAQDADSCLRRNA